MNIGVVVDNEYNHDHRVQKEVRLLEADGHRVFVLCFDFGGTHIKQSISSITRIRLPKKIKDLLVLLSTNFNFYERFWQFYISKWINANHIDMLHAHDLYMAKAAKLGIKKSTRTIQLTLDLHENYPAAINTYLWAIKGWRKYIVQPKKWYSKEAEYLNFADKLVVLSESFKTDLTIRFPFLKSETIFVHPNMPDLESFQDFESNDLSVDFSSKLPCLFYFGVVAKRRGIIDTLPWIINLLKQGNQFHTLIIGPTDKADKAIFNSYINHPVLKDRLTYIPWEDVKYLPAYLKKIDIGLAPFEVNAQHDSGVANKLFQYMYGKIPILATECKAQKELIENANCGLLYSNQDSFNSAILQLLNNKKLKQELGENGKSALMQLYAAQADRQFLEIYSK